MKKILYAGLFLALAFVGLKTFQPAQATGTQLLPTPFHMVGNNGDANAYGAWVGNLVGYSSITVTYDLHGLCALGGDASALIIDQSGWKYVSLSSYGTNCLNGSQTVTIPLSNFPGLDLNGSGGTFHSRFWYSGAFTVDITSAVLNPSNQAPTVTATATPTSGITPLAVNFTATATDTDGSIASYAWTFGDSGTATSSNPSHTYTSTGTFVSTVTVTDNQGAQASSSVTTTVIAPVPTWAIQSVDMMKYTKDNICSQSSTSTIDTLVQKAVDVGANYVAISGYYVNPACADDTAYMTRWVNSIRSHGLKVWFRMKDPAFEGDYSVAKTTSPDNMRHQLYMVNWITANNLVANGDIFTPNAEPQNGGINGVTYCGSPANCQFSSKADFNLWLRQTHTLADLALKAKGLTTVKVGYYGFDGFVAAGLGNPDWQGQSQLEASTITMMGNVAIDHYPETIGHTLAQDLPTIKTAIGSTTPIIISEYGTITTSSTTVASAQLNAFATTAAGEPNITGLNYWTLAGGSEALLDGSFNNKPTFSVLKSFYQH